MKKYKVYVLKDYFTDKIRYVGCTETELRKRLWGHVRAAKEKHPHNYGMKKWINSHVEQDVRPHIVLGAEFDTREEMYDAERDWIRKLKDAGIKLLNIQMGGNRDHGKIVKEEKDYLYKVVEVHQYDLEGNYIRSFPSKKKAAKSVDIAHSAITHATNISRYTPQAGGFYWSNHKVDKLTIVQPVLGNTGKKMSEKNKELYRKLFTGRKWKPESVAQRSETNKKPIKQMDKDGNTIKVWPSQKDIRLELGIKLYCDRFPKSVQHGYRWDYA
jgi:hypothetical protein